MNGNAANRLVSTDVERTNRERALRGKRRRELSGRLIILKLFFFRRFAFVIEPKIFRTVESDSACSELTHSAHRRSRMKIGKDVNNITVLERTRHLFLNDVSDRPLLVDKSLKLTNRLVVGRNRNCTSITVKQHRLARAHDFGYISEAHDSWYS